MGSEMCIRDSLDLIHEGRVCKIDVIGGAAGLTNLGSVIREQPEQHLAINELALVEVPGLAVKPIDRIDEELARKHPLELDFSILAVDLKTARAEHRRIKQDLRRELVQPALVEGLICELLQEARPPL